MATKKNSTKATEQQRTVIAGELLYEVISKIIAMRQLTFSCMQEAQISEGASNALVAMRSILNVCGYLVEKSIRTLDPKEPGIMGDIEAWVLAERTQDKLDELAKALKAQATA